MPKRTDIKKIMLIGSGPIVIGQACEFDYSGTQACKALREEGYEVVLVNSNPATIMTDPDFADVTYIEAATPQMQASAARQAAGGALGQGAAPVKVSLPLEGQPLFFEKLLALDEDLVVSFDFKGIKD